MNMIKIIGNYETLTYISPLKLIVLVSLIYLKKVAVTGDINSTTLVSPYIRNQNISYLYLYVHNTYICRDFLLTIIS